MTAPAAFVLAGCDAWIQRGASALRSWDETLRWPGGASPLPRSAIAAPAAPPFEPVSLFDDPAWSQWPYLLYRRHFEAQRQWLEQAARSGQGTERHHQKMIAFAARLWIDALSPTNCPWTNPAVVAETWRSGGANLVRGAINLAEDVTRQALHGPAPDARQFVPGTTVATTPGKVVFRNALIELIQYAPATASTYPEPVLVVSAWIMKYYILDLSPQNSLIGYLVSRGHTVFAISWKNPEAADAGVGISDYLQLGILAALQTIGLIMPGVRIHALGYCLGGTLLAIAAAALARDRDGRLATVTLLAAQTDFTEPGDLALFIDESQLAFIESLMARDGYLDADFMAAAFRWLNPEDLVWKPAVERYLLGNRVAPTDLFAWNADGTRLPYRMHADYLRQFYRDNALAESRFVVEGRPVCLNDLQVPIFLVGTETDHVAPWRSVYKLHHLCSAEITFVLTSGGHNAGIVSEPGHPHRSYRIGRRERGDPYRSPDAFLQRHARIEGSWWPALQTWLARHSSSRAGAPATGAPERGLPVLCDAPGTYVHMR